MAALVHVAMEFSFKPTISILNVLSMDFQRTSFRFLLNSQSALIKSQL